MAKQHPAAYGEPSPDLRFVPISLEPATRKTGLLYIVIDDGEHQSVWVNPLAPRLIDAPEAFKRR